MAIYKIRLTAALFGIGIARRLYDATKSETRADPFLANVDANDRIPGRQAGDRFLPYSAERVPLAVGVKS